MEVDSQPEEDHGLGEPKETSIEAEVYEMLVSKCILRSCEDLDQFFSFHYEKGKLRVSNGVDVGTSRNHQLHQSQLLTTGDRVKIELAQDSTDPELPFALRIQLTGRRPRTPERLFITRLGFVHRDGQETLVFCPYLAKVLTEQYNRPRDCKLELQQAAWGKEPVTKGDLVEILEVAAPLRWADGYTSPLTITRVAKLDQKTFGQMGGIKGATPNQSYDAAAYAKDFGYLFQAALEYEDFVSEERSMNQSTSQARVHWNPTEKGIDGTFKVAFMSWNTEEDKRKPLTLEIKVGDEVVVIPGKKRMELGGGITLRVTSVVKMTDNNQGGTFQVANGRNHLTMKKVRQLATQDPETTVYSIRKKTDTTWKELRQSLFWADMDNLKARHMRVSIPRAMGSPHVVGPVARELLQLLTDAPGIAGDLQSVTAVEPPSEEEIQAMGLTLTTPQHQVIQRILHTGAPLTACQGPPGTGKSTIIVAAAFGILKADDKNRVLVTAPSNKAANHIARVLRRYFHQPGQKPCLLRILPPKYDGCTELVKGIEDVSLSCLAENGYPDEGEAVDRERATLAVKEERHREALEQCLKNTNPGTEQAVSLLTTEIEEKKLALRETIVEDINPRIVIATCGAVVYKGISDLVYTHIFVDEAGQASQPDVLNAARLLIFRKERDLPSQLILLGDQKQLTPIAQAQGLAGTTLRTSALEALENRGRVPIITLLDCFRLPFSHVIFPNAEFYQEQLRARRSPEEINQLVQAVDWVNPAIPLMWLRVEGYDNPVSGTSRENGEEARMVKDIVDQAVEQGLPKSQIMVITPYNGQRFLLQEQFQYDPEMAIETINGAQGMEATLVVLSLVRCHKAATPRKDTAYPIGFLSDAGRLCVSLTRAKAGLVIIGHPETLAQDPAWGRCLTYMVQEGLVATKLGNQFQLFQHHQVFALVEARSPAREAVQAQRLTQTEVATLFATQAELPQPGTMEWQAEFPAMGTPARRETAKRGNQQKPRQQKDQTRTTGENIQQANLERYNNLLDRNDSKARVCLTPGHLFFAGGRGRSRGAIFSNLAWMLVSHHLTAGYFGREGYRAFDYMFVSSEQLYQFCKAVLALDEEKMELIGNTRDPWKNMHQGGQVIGDQGFQTWWRGHLRRAVMVATLIMKFHHGWTRDVLLETEGLNLHEATIHPVWGCGTPLDQIKASGVPGNIRFRPAPLWGPDTMNGDDQLGICLEFVRRACHRQQKWAFVVADAIWEGLNPEAAEGFTIVPLLVGHQAPLWLLLDMVSVLTPFLNQLPETVVTLILNCMELEDPQCQYSSQDLAEATSKTFHRIKATFPDLKLAVLFPSFGRTELAEGRVATMGRLLQDGAENSFPVLPTPVPPSPYQANGSLSGEALTAMEVTIQDVVETLLP